MSAPHATGRSCAVCRIRETADYPFPSLEWALCPNHAEADTADRELLHSEWLRLMIERHGHGAL